MAVEFRLLGAVQVHVDGQPIDAGGSRRRAVLAALLADAGRMVGQDVLVDRVWGGAPPDSAVASLRSHVTRIRRALEQADAAADPLPAHIARMRGGYRIDVNPDLVDLHRFRRLVAEARGLPSDDEARVRLLRQASGLWLGQPLTGISGQWAERARAAWQREYLDAVVAWGRAEVRTGDPHRVLTPIAELAQDHPLVESLTEVLLRALVAVGRPTDALDQARRHRELLAGEYGTDQSAELRALQAEILRGGRHGATGSAHQVAGSGVAATTASRYDASPHPPPRAERTLPADTAGFVGRHDELRRLSTDTAGDSPRAAAIYVVDGMAGVGKTTLAIHAAHRLVERFPDGQRFIALRAHAPDQRRVDPATALEILLQADGVAARQIPAGLDARTGLWRDRTAAKRLLLVIDDAFDDTDVAPLLPSGPGCLVLVTSRRRLCNLPGASSLFLDTLPADAAADLFLHRAGRGHDDRTAVDRVVRLCGYLPLALALTAARLQTHPAWTVADLADDLEAASDRLVELASGPLAVKAAFDLSYRDLTPDRQRLFRRLGLHPGSDFDTLSAAALIDAPLAEARAGLENLLEHRLITEPHRGRFRFHDLIADYAHALAATDPQADQDAAHDRLLDYYLHTSAAAAACLTLRVPHSTDAAQSSRPATHRPALLTPAQATDWLAGEQPNLVVAARWAAAHDRIPAAVGIPAALHEHLRACGPWALALDLHRTALDAARRTGDRPAQVRALTNLADAQCLTAGYDRAAAIAWQAVDLSRLIGDQPGEAHALNTLGLVQRMANDFAASAASFERALRLFRQLGDRRGEAYALELLGRVRLMTGDYREAATAARRALELSEELGNQRGQAYAQYALGILHYLRADFTASAVSLGRVLELSGELGDRLMRTAALITLGRTQYETGDYPGAAVSARLATELSVELGDPISQLTALVLTAFVLYGTGDHTAAATTAQQAIAMAQALGNTLSCANALNAFGRVQHDAGEFEAAEVAFGRALGQFREVGNPDGEAETLTYLGNLLLDRGSAAAARERFAAALAIATRIGTPLYEARALEGLGLCDIHEGNNAGAANLHQALKIYRRVNAPYATATEAAQLRFPLRGAIGEAAAVSSGE